MVNRKKIRRSWGGRLFNATIAVVVFYFSVNFIWQIVRKPSELLNLLGTAQARGPEQLWRDYGPDFKKYQTDLIPASLLAAIAQVESAGNPIATPQWKWNWRGGWFEIYAPASSSVGLFQFTDGTFREAQKYCVVDGKVRRDGPWYDFGSCWFNQLYTRTWPSHAIEMTSAYLDNRMRELAKFWGGHRDPDRARLWLAAITHLCGSRRSRHFAHNGLRLESLGRCGSHHAGYYVRQVEKTEQIFRRWTGHLLNHERR